MTESFQRLALLALAFIAWALADQIGGNGFIAAFVGGLVVGPTVERVGERLLRFTESEGQLLNLSVFFIFGVLALGLLGSFTWQISLYVLLSLTVVRMLPVAAALLGTHLRGVSVLFAGWFGPRGLASIVLGLIVVAEAPQLQGPARSRWLWHRRYSLACSCTGSRPPRSRPRTPAGSKGCQRTPRRRKKHPRSRPAWNRRRPACA